MIPITNAGLDRKGRKWSWPVPKKLSKLFPEDSKEIKKKDQSEQPVPNIAVPVVV